MRTGGTTVTSTAPTTSGGVTVGWTGGGTMATTSTGLKAYQYGGLVADTGVAHLTAGELVLPPALTRDLAALLGGGQAAAPRGGGTTMTTDDRQLHVVVNLHGIEDRDVPRRTVAAIREALGREYQKEAALAGNVSLGD
jgi:hypothetical protein